MSEDPEVKKQWLDRAHAMGRTQSTYLWVTFVTAVFFFALKRSAKKGQEVSVPLIDLKLDAQAVLAAGPFVLALLVVAAIGSMQAWGDALRKYAGDDWLEAADRLDQHPNALDLALYTTRGGPRVLDHVIFLLGYPGCLSLILFESVWILLWLLNSDVPGRSVLSAAACLALSGAIFLVAQMWYKRIKRVFVASNKPEENCTGKTARTGLGSLYLLTTLLLLVHQIDSAYWHEWKLFGLPGGIQSYLGANILIIAPFLVGLLRLQTAPHVGARFGIGLSIVGVGAFGIHAWFWFRGHQEFLSFASIAVLTGSLMTSTGLGWQCLRTLKDGKASTTRERTRESGGALETRSDQREGADV